MKFDKMTLIIGGCFTALLVFVAYRYYNYRNIPESARTPSAFLDALEILDLRFNDLKYAFKNAEETDAPVVLIAVDEDAIREVGRFPWDRDIVARITENLMELGIGSLGFDIINSESQQGQPEKDLAFAQVIEKYSDRVVLGTFSDVAFDFESYKDYCITEAFLANSGDQIVKLNPSFIVDDVSGVFDSLEWKKVFDVLFFNQKEVAKIAVMRSLEKNSEEQLTAYQRNFLKSEQGKSLFDYCRTWLTKDDFFIETGEMRAKIYPFYQEVFNGDKELAKMPVQDVLAKLKTSIPRHPVPQYGEWLPNTSVLQEPALYTASFLTDLDSDGYVRRYPLFFRSGNRIGSSYIPSLALQVYLAAKGYRADVKIEKLSGYSKLKAITQFKIIDPSQDPEKTVMDVPVDSMGRTMLHYYGRQMSLPYVSAKELLNDSSYVRVRRSIQDPSTNKIIVREDKEPKDKFFKGRAGIVGATATALYDLRNTPVEGNYPGPEIHLTMLANLLDQKFVKSLPEEQVIIMGSMVVLGVSVTLIWAIAGALTSLLVFLALAAALAAADIYLFLSQQVVTSSIFLMMLLSGIYFLVTIMNYFTEESKKKEIKSTFSKYVSPAVVDELLKSVDNLKLGGRKQVMTVFFSDVRGFTTISEKLSPVDLSRLLNRYLTPMTELVFKNHGTLDKYMGDAIMAFFGAPIATEEHPHQACRCALQSLVQLKEINEIFKAEKLPEIDIGIGINTGEMSVGNMGSNIVQNYTVMGDSVNLASRLEGINKTYGTRIIISEFTQSQVKDSFITRVVDRVKVKGKNEPVQIFELIGEGQATDQIKAWLEVFNKGMEQYLKQEFQAATETFKECIKLRGEDPVAELYIERCEDFIKEPPGDQWDGVYESKTK